MEQVGGWRKGPWTPQEDKLLIQYISQNGEGRWSSVCKCTGLKRSGKSCRLRWVNYLRPGLKKGQLTPQEEGIIIELHSLWGNKWSTIARYLPGRTDNEIKNYWRTHFKTRNRKPSHSHSKQEKMLQQQSEITDDVKPGFSESPNSTKEEEEEDDEIAMMMNNHQPEIASDFIPMDCYLWDGLWNLDDDAICSRMSVDGNQPNNVANYYHPFEGDTHTLDYVQSQTGLLLL